LDVPFILVTGTVPEDVAVECIKHGVSDCVLKSRLFRLPVALERALNEKAQRDARAQVQADVAQRQRQRGTAG